MQLLTSKLGAWMIGSLAADLSSTNNSRGFRKPWNLKGCQKMRFRVKEILKKYARSIAKIYTDLPILPQIQKTEKMLENNRYGLYFSRS